MPVYNEPIETLDDVLDSLFSIGYMPSGTIVRLRCHYYEAMTMKLEIYMPPEVESYRSLASWVDWVFPMSSQFDWSAIPLWSTYTPPCALPLKRVHPGPSERPLSVFRAFQSKQTLMRPAVA